LPPHPPSSSSEAFVSECRKLAVSDPKGSTNGRIAFCWRSVPGLRLKSHTFTPRAIGAGTGNRMARLLDIFRGEVRSMNHFLGGVRRLRAAMRDFIVEVLNDRFWEGCGRDSR
jgi:hypothetical protein